MANSQRQNSSRVIPQKPRTKNTRRRTPNTPTHATDVKTHTHTQQHTRHPTNGKNETKTFCLFLCAWKHIFLKNILTLFLSTTNRYGSHLRERERERDGVGGNFKIVVPGWRWTNRQDIPARIFFSFSCFSLSFSLPLFFLIISFYNTFYGGISDGRQTDFKVFFRCVELKQKHLLTKEILLDFPGLYRFFSHKNTPVLSFSLSNHEEKHSHRKQTDKNQKFGLSGLEPRLCFLMIENRKEEKDL